MSASVNQYRQKGGSVNECWQFIGRHRLQSTVVNDCWRIVGRPWESQGIGATLDAAIKDWAYKNGQRID